MPTKKKLKRGISIVKSGNQLFVRTVASNGNILNNSETVKRKLSCFKNIIASAKLGVEILSGTKFVTDENGVKWVFTGKKFEKVI